MHARGTRAFFDLLNGRKRSVGLDLQNRHGTHVLRELVRRADVVIEASRARALAQFGIDGREEVGADGGPQVWVSITGYGRLGARTPEDRVTFGDDAAAAGGLVSGGDDGPLFCAGHAAADPLTGLTAAGACVDALRLGRARVPRYLHGRRRPRTSPAVPTLPAPAGLAVTTRRRTP